jgi:hypothetical protein
MVESPTSQTDILLKSAAAKRRQSDIRLKVAITQIPRSADDYDSKINYFVAREVVQLELEGADPIGYCSLTDTTRDMLIAHTRQDAAHALLNTISLVSRVRWLTTMVRALLGLVVLLVIALSVLWARH